MNLLELELDSTVDRGVVPVSCPELFDVVVVVDLLLGGPINRFWNHVCIKLNLFLEWTMLSSILRILRSIESITPIFNEASHRNCCQTSWKQLPSQRFIAVPCSLWLSLARFRRKISCCYWQWLILREEKMTADECCQIGNDSFLTAAVHKRPLSKTQQEPKSLGLITGSSGQPVRLSLLSLLFYQQLSKTAKKTSQLQKSGRKRKRRTFPWLFL